MSQTYDFPPTLNPLVYITIFHVPLLAFIFLSLKPIACKSHACALCIIIFVQILIPFLYHGIYESQMNLTIALLAMLYTSKMMIWLKKNYQSSIDSKIPSFTASLFNWRPNVVKIPDESRHQKYIDSINELGYLPIRSYFKHNKTLGQVLGICSVFLISGLFHDYIAIVAFNHFSLDYVVFFLFHGILLILWEAIEGKILGRGKDFKDNFGSKVFKMALFLPIAIFTTPLFAEPYVNGIDFHSHLNICTNLTKWTNKKIFLCNTQ
ncbi:hypothetical protein C2G38_2189457 [Gigaspora rosea]|uniref:Wax synthase domain-containing protein n=1 Tax=Gigaspora rosea TaxID=44941 RepID=A0A397V2H0_9GLOM|nr:hypothetical protein C2G38_2189457 [Gigaspora rosea]